MPEEFYAELKDSSRDAVKIIELKGELDEINVEKLKVIIDGLLDNQNIKAVILNLSELRFINSKGIGYLVSIHSHLNKDQRTLSLVGASESVMDVLSLVGLPTIVPYFESLEEAIAKA